MNTSSVSLYHVSFVSLPFLEEWSNRKEELQAPKEEPEGLSYEEQRI